MEATERGCAVSSGCEPEHYLQPGPPGEDQKLRMELRGPLTDFVFHLHHGLYQQYEDYMYTMLQFFALRSYPFKQMAMFWGLIARELWDLYCERQGTAGGWALLRYYSALYNSVPPELLWDMPTRKDVVNTIC